MIHRRWCNNEQRSHTIDWVFLWIWHVQQGGRTLAASCSLSACTPCFCQGNHQVTTVIESGFFVLSQGAAGGEEGGGDGGGRLFHLQRAREDHPHADSATPPLRNGPQALGLPETRAHLHRRRHAAQVGMHLFSLHALPAKIDEGASSSQAAGKRCHDRTPCWTRQIQASPNHPGVP